MKKITLQWQGKDYIITEGEAFALGEAVEDIVTIPELPGLLANPKFFKIAKVYAVMLRHAGARVTDAEVHSAIMGQIKEGGKDAQDLIVASALSALVEVLMDGAPESDGDDDAGKKAVAS